VVDSLRFYAPDGPTLADVGAMMVIQTVESYLAMRQAAGFSLPLPGHRLRSFAASAQ
jgi:hypothetical protein